MNETIKFKKNQMTWNGMVEDVIYEIDGNRVIVEGKSKLSQVMGIKSEYIIINKNTIKKNDLDGGTTEYNRTQWAE